ncbi:cell division ATPase MinD [Haloferax profundi]|uniref:CobQ/CobB/MinD/ParA nucleotide binding domain-containing protein n=1 Tax=Haloferax profundi TaxID=1544718 RepID=A0A0W1SUV2_9EURY|nr:cell division ATPase MinD [Haloferax profundi]KTG29602.1 hypothetical protein AUR66_09755 [Haloferax profundi]
MARVYAIASAKGGVGKTTTTANLGTVLSMAGQDVVVVDGDLGMPNLAGALGVDPDRETLHDVLTGETTVESATYEGPEGLSVLPGSTALEAFASANAKELHPVIEELKERYDIVLIDTGAGLSDDTFVPLKLADEVLLVSTTEREALGDTEKTRQLGERIGADVVGVVLTRVNQSNPNADEVASLLDTGVIAVVPEDSAIREALSTQVPVVARAPNSIAAAGYRALAEALTGNPVPIPDALADDVDQSSDSTGSTSADAEDVVDTPDPADDDADAAADDVTVVETDGDSGSDSVAGDTPPTETAIDEAAPESTPDTDLDPESTPESDSEPQSTPKSFRDQASEPEPEPDPTVEAATATEATQEPESDSAPESSPDPEPVQEPLADPESSPDETTTDEPAATAATLEDEAEAALDAAIPFGSGDDESSEAVDDDPLAGDASDTTADEEPSEDVAPAEDPVTANLDAADSMGADPLAGDEVVEPTSGPGVADGPDTRGVDADHLPSTEDSDGDAASTDSDDATDPSNSDDASVVVEDASSEPTDEPLVAEAEPDATQQSAEVVDSADGDDDEEGVYTTSLVEEVESLDDEDEEKKKGFFSRFLG